MPSRRLTFPYGPSHTPRPIAMPGCSLRAWATAPQHRNSQSPPQAKTAARATDSSARKSRQASPERRRLTVARRPDPQ